MLNTAPDEPNARISPAVASASTADSAMPSHFVPFHPASTSPPPMGLPSPQRGLLLSPAVRALQPCHVLAYDWPCWSPVLACFPWAACKTYSHLQSFSLPGCLPLSDTSHLENTGHDTIFFLSGPWSFVGPYWEMLSPVSPVVAALDFSSSPDGSPSGLWLTLKHAHYGGGGYGRRMVVGFVAAAF